MLAIVLWGVLNILIIPTMTFHQSYSMAYLPEQSGPLECCMVMSGILFFFQLGP